MTDSIKHFSTGPGVGASPLFAPSPAGCHSSDVLFQLDEVNEDEDEAKSNEALQRLLNEVTLAVAADEAAEEGDATNTHNSNSGTSHHPHHSAPLFVSRHAAPPLPPHGSRYGGEEDPNVILASFSVSGSGPPGGDLYPSGGGGRSFTSLPAAAAPSNGGGGGFVVEAAALPPPPSASLSAHITPPPVYGTPSLGAATPYSCYSGIPAAASGGHPGKAPPSFAEAIASTTPLSLQGRSPAEMTLMAAHYVPPGPAAAPDPILLRNANGVFLLNPILSSAKPALPYTPPAGTDTPPISPLPRYSLPPPQGAMPGAFLGASAAHAAMVGRPRAGSVRSAARDLLPPPPPPPPPPQYGTSPIVGYTQSISSVRGTPSFGAAPPPYSA